MSPRMPKEVVPAWTRKEKAVRSDIGYINLFFHKIGVYRR